MRHLGSGHTNQYKVPINQFIVGVLTLLTDKWLPFDDIRSALVKIAA